MFDSYGAPILRADALGVVRNAAGFDTGMRLGPPTLSATPSRLLQASGCDTGLTLRNDRVYDRWNQPTWATIEPYRPWNR